MLKNLKCHMIEIRFLLKFLSWFCLQQLSLLLFDIIHLMGKEQAIFHTIITDRFQILSLMDWNVHIFLLYFVSILKLRICTTFGWKHTYCVTSCTVELKCNLLHFHTAWSITNIKIRLSLTFQNSFPFIFSPCFSVNLHRACAAFRTRPVVCFRLLVSWCIMQTKWPLWGRSVNLSLCSHSRICLCFSKCCDCLREVTGAFIKRAARMVSGRVFCLWWIPDLSKSGLCSISL